MSDSIGIALVGYKFMGKAHSHAYHDVTMFFPDVRLKPEMKLLIGRNKQWVTDAAKQYGWQEIETDFSKAVLRDDIQLVDITSPSNAHSWMAIEAAEHGKHVFCEKPMALTLADAREMLKAAEANGVKHMVNFNYRTVPAIALVKQMIENGDLGTIYHWRSQYLQDWIIDPDFPLVWRLQKDVAGSGALGDLGAHSIDLARWLVGEIKQVVGLYKTFIKQRPLAESMDGLSARKSSNMGEVTVDDATLWLAEFENGAIGTFEATRFAPGRKNYNFFEINGSKGSVVFCFERMNELQYYDVDDPEGLHGFRLIQATDSSHPYMSAWWPPGHIIGYEHTFIHQVRNLLNALADDEMPTPNFYDGVACQQVLEAVELSCREKQWIPVNQL